MGERSEHSPGTFSWVDLATTDVEGAKSFYSGLFDWDFEDMSAEGIGTYTMFMIDDKSVAACYEQLAEQREQGIPPTWLSYITVRNVDESTTAARGLGATVLQEPADVVDSGRMAVFSDPQGAAVALWQPRAHIGAQLVNVPGALSWNELRTTDQPAAVRFYVDLFGWGTEDNDMGPAGTYTIVKVGDRANGAIMPLSTETAGVPPHWAPYFVAEDTDKSTARVQELGGNVLMPPTDVPQGRISVVTDPQGTSFSLFAGPLDP